MHLLQLIEKTECVNNISDLALLFFIVASCQLPFKFITYFKSTKSTVRLYLKLAQGLPMLFVWWETYARHNVCKFFRLHHNQIKFIRQQ
jgi:hypothetical protein